MRTRRRHVRKRRGSNTRAINFKPIVIIICAAVLMGYFTAQYIIYPLIYIGDDDTSHEFENMFTRLIDDIVADDGENEIETSEDSQIPIVQDGLDIQQEITTTVEISDTVDGVSTQEAQIQTQVEEQIEEQQQSGYCIQFGSFSTEESAQKLINELLAAGIASEIFQSDGFYKVIGQLFQTESEATAARTAITDSKYKDAFIIQK